MGPSPSADLVGSILGAVGEDKSFNRASLRKTTSERTISAESKNSLYSPSQGNVSGKEPPMQIVWRNVLIFIYLHAAALYGFYLCFTAAKASTLVWCTRHFYLVFCNSSSVKVFFFLLTAFFLFLFGGFGITGGAHRLWAHRCYKAKWPLRLLAAVAQTIAVQV